MKMFGFGADVGRHIDAHGSDFLISRLIHSESLHVACMRMGPGGLIGYHQAMTHQLFAVVEGAGWVRGESSDRVPIKAGQAVVWRTGELHEAGTETGLVAIVVEGDAVEA